VATGMPPAHSVVPARSAVVAERSPKRRGRGARAQPRDALQPHEEAGYPTAPARRCGRRARGMPMPPGRPNPPGRTRSN
jgi:hypothetical protein